MGHSFAIITVSGNFFLSSAILFFAQLPFSTSMGIIIGVNLFLVIVGQILHMLHGEANPVDSVWIKTSDGKQSIARPSSINGEVTYSGISNAWPQTIYMFFVAPIVNIWLVLHLIAACRG
jgi:hypothetical protein